MEVLKAESRLHSAGYCVLRSESWVRIDQDWHKNIHGKPGSLSCSRNCFFLSELYFFCLIGFAFDHDCTKMTRERKSSYADLEKAWWGWWHTGYTFILVSLRKITADMKNIWNSHLPHLMSIRWRTRGYLQTLFKRPFEGYCRWKRKTGIARQS